MDYYNSKFNLLIPAHFKCEGKAYQEISIQMRMIHDVQEKISIRKHITARKINREEGSVNHLNSNINKRDEGDETTKFMI